MAVPKKGEGWVPKRSKSRGQGWGGCKGFGCGGVGGRHWGTEAFFEGCPVRWGGILTGAGLVDGGVDQGP